MSSEHKSLFTVTALEFARKHAACPSCHVVPRDGVMLMCENGHNVCAICKVRLDRDDDDDAKCPRCCGGYLEPPTVNRSVADIVGSIPLDACRFTVVDWEILWRQAECPVCGEVPRDDGETMLVCTDGHNLCSACKAELSPNSRCPHGHCGFLEPPTRNEMVADIIASMPCRACRIALASDLEGCNFVNLIDADRERHETVCKYRLVPCPNSACDGRSYVHACEVVAHYWSAHKMPSSPITAAENESSDPDELERWYFWKRDNSFDKKCYGWAEQPFETRAGGWMVAVVRARQGAVYFWVQRIDREISNEDGSEKKLRCKITVGRTDAPVRLEAPVYPIDWHRDRIMDDEDCARLSTSPDMKKMMSLYISDEARAAGYGSMFRVRFRVIDGGRKKSDLLRSLFSCCCRD